jgi:hypothetical protein
MAEDEYDMSVTFNMLLCCKMTALAYCYEDGGKVKKGITITED